MFLLGCGGTAYAVRMSFAPARSTAILFGLLAPVAILVGLLGALLLFVPRFL